jgi:glycosyltransferase involved in cell wall biosynthesis
MKILMLGSKEYPFGVSARHDPKAGGGIEHMVEKLSKYLARRGHEVSIVTRKFPGQARCESINHVHVTRTCYLPNKYLRAFSFNFLGFFKSIWLIRNNRIDLIHAHAVTAGFFGAILTGLMGKPMLFTPHGTIVIWRFPVREILGFFQRVALKAARKTLFISRPARELLSLFSRDHSLLTNAIDLEDYDFEPTASRGVRFLFLGRLEKVKGVDTLIDAFRIVVKKYPDSRLLIAGKGSEKNRIVDMILKSGSDRIRYMGWMDSREALKSSDVFVLPSTEKGLPVALLEAMAAGRIIITSLPFIKPGKTGLHCKPADPRDLARKMQMVCQKPGHYRKLGRQARVEARSFSWDSVVSGFEKEYQKALQ